MARSARDAKIDNRTARLKLPVGERRYVTVGEGILPVFSDKLVGELTTPEIRSWLNKLASTPARKRSGRGKKTAYRSKPSTPDENRARKW